ncbi:RNA polymerase sigma factor [Deinococcus oregonensis]|uniref:RNA polymerase sigma factor n=1 Tax=Deinococcus oregonensis TaxID=1805970 RepID=A0ABV6B231_9DEIO
MTLNDFPRSPELHSWPDEALVQVFRQPGPHSEGAFEVLVERHAPRIHRLAASMVGPGAADDVVQDVFIAVHGGLKTFRAEAAFTTWLHRIALNACGRALKARQNVPFESVTEPAAPHNLALSGENTDLRERLARAMHTLPPDQREALALRELSGLDYAEIADITGAELGTVKSRINRARAALRTLLTRTGVTP